MKELEKRIEIATKRNGPVHVTDTTFDSILKKNPVVLIDFFAEWCGPCRALSPRIEELAKEYDDKVFVGKIDIDKNPKIADSFNVRSIPTLVLLKDGKEVDRIIGAAPRRTIEKAMNEAFGNCKKRISGRKPKVTCSRPTTSQHYSGYQDRKGRRNRYEESRK